VRTREFGLSLKFGHPHPDDAEMLRANKVQNGVHVAHIDSFWLSMWIAEIVCSAKKIRSHSLLEALDALRWKPLSRMHRRLPLF
jgi:hypothetical protein